ncbi:MAG: YciI family protein [Solirubrobacteraceae bacterium]
MKYMLLIHQGTTPLPGSEEWDALTDEQRGAVYGAYQSLNETPGVTPGIARMGPPDAATTVRVQDGRTLTTDGPFVELKEALGGYMFYDADDLDAAIEVAARVPAASMGGWVEIRPMMKG